MFADVQAAVSGRPAELALLMLLDFDGTLAEFHPDPSVPALTAARRDAIEAIARHPGTDVGIVSGRRVDDLRGRTRLSPGIYLAGLHGLEIAVDDRAWRHPDLERAAHMVEGLVPALTMVARSTPGALVEDKGASVAIHVRQVAEGDRADVLRRTDEAAGPWLADGRVRRMDGHAVVEYLPNIAGHKGEALRWIQADVERRRGRGAWVVYVGDDRTDEDAFRAITAGVGVLVGSRPSAATHQLADVAEVELFLSWLRAKG